MTPKDMYELKWSAVYYKFWDKKYASYREEKKKQRKRIRFTDSLKETCWQHMVKEISEQSKFKKETYQTGNTI